jgi:hypothetical protein
MSTFIFRAAVAVAAAAAVTTAAVVGTKIYRKRLAARKAVALLGGPVLVVEPAQTSASIDELCAEIEQLDAEISALEAAIIETGEDMPMPGQPGYEQWQLEMGSAVREYRGLLDQRHALYLAWEAAEQATSAAA